MKQRLEIQRFFGASETAVKSQIGVSVAVCVPVAIVRKALGIELSPTRMMQSTPVLLFEQVPLQELFTASWLPPAPDAAPQMLLSES